MQHAFNKRQQGFTLLELLVVITLLAVLAVGALVAYEDVGENAESAAQANTGGTIDRAIRTYRSVEALYPNQWDSLSTQTGAAVSVLAPATQAFIGNLAVPTANSAVNSIENSLIEAGIEELQFANTVATGVAPNRAHNESTNTGAAEFDLTDTPGSLANISVVPTGACTVGDYTGLMQTTFDGTLAASGVSPNHIQNRYADSLEGDECHLLVALGFGGDAAASTISSTVAIAQSPTFSKKGAIDPATQYARYIGLFHVGAADTGAGTSIGSYLPKARLVAVVAPDGSNLDQLVSEAQPTVAP